MRTCVFIVYCRDNYDFSRMLTYDMDSKARNRAIGDRIRLAREAKGWSQEALADELDTKQATVARWEAGSFPKRIGLPKIAEVLGKPVEWFQGEFLSEDRRREFGARLKRMRIRAGFATELDFAKAVGVDVTIVHQWENGHVMPTKHQGDDISYALGMSPAFITLGEDELKARGIDQSPEEFAFKRLVFKVLDLEKRIIHLERRKPTLIEASEGSANQLSNDELDLVRLFRSAPEIQNTVLAQVRTTVGLGKSQAGPSPKVKATKTTGKKR
jgi:transcriptional regulator with XRE-family HTH domain